MQPNRKKVSAGEEWFVQLVPGANAIAVEIDEVTRATVVLRRVADLHYRPKGYDVPVRYARQDITFLERLPR